RVRITDEPLDGRAAGRVAERWDRLVDDRLRLAGLLILGIYDLVQPVRWVGHEQRKDARPALGALTHRVEQWLCCGSLVRHHEHSRARLRGLHRGTPFEPGLRRSSHYD